MGGQIPRELHGARQASLRPADGQARSVGAVTADSAGTTVLFPTSCTDVNVG